MHFFLLGFLYFPVIVSITFKEFCLVKGVFINVNFVAGNNLLSSGTFASYLGDYNEKNAKEGYTRSSAVEKEVKTKLKENPFQQWKYKSQWNQLSDLKLSRDLMSKAVQPGDPARLRSVLMKALKGQQINMVVIGGSNSAGGKLGVDQGSLEGLFFKVFVNWWNKTFGKTIKVFIKEYQVAIGGTGSYVFAYCYKTFIPKDQNMDIVLIEASINYNTRSKAESLEQLTRQVLAEPSSPAVLYINLVSGVGLDPQTKTVINPSCVNLENFGQTELARHYGITSFSLKELLCRKEYDRWNAAITDFASSDGRHVGIKGHAQIAMLMIEYVRDVFSEVLYDVKVNTEETIPLPELFFLKRETEALKEPLCWTGITPDIFQDLPHPNLPIEIIESKGFSETSLKQSGLRTDAQGGWGTWDSYSILKLRIHVPPIESHSPTSRSVIIVTRTFGSGGKAMVWLDNNEDKAIYINSKSVFGNNQLNTIATRVEPGYHVITVKTVRRGMFLVSGLLVGPPDFERRGVL